MGRKGQAALGAGAHEEEFAELQRRFDALSSAKKLSETSPALLTKDMYRTEKKQQAVRRDDPQLHAQLKTLDEQIVQLRRRHDRLHDNNNKKRRELDLLADRLQDLHNSAFKSEDAPQVRLRAQEERLVAAAHRYEESHRTKLTYEQVIERLKTEQLSWPEEVKALDTTLVQKEADYEQLLLMSHGARPSLRCPPAPVTLLSHPAPPAAAPCADANSSKEAAKAELAKFESLVADERRMRERELNERRQALQKKQTLATELEKNERERRAALQVGAQLGAQFSAQFSARNSRRNSLVAEHRRGVLVLEAEGEEAGDRRRRLRRLRQLRRHVRRIADVIEGRLARRLELRPRPRRLAVDADRRRAGGEHVVRA